MLKESFIGPPKWIQGPNSLIHLLTPFQAHEQQTELEVQWLGLKLALGSGLPAPEQSVLTHSLFYSNNPFTHALTKIFTYKILPLSYVFL